MKLILHGVAFTSAIIAFLMLASSIRTGQLGPFVAIVAIAAVVAIAYSAIVAGLGLLGGVPTSQWPAIAKQLFRGEVKHDG